VSVVDLHKVPKLASELEVGDIIFFANRWEEIVAIVQKVNYSNVELVNGGSFDVRNDSNVIIKRKRKES
jgi:CO dehydrogenase nickel-insertion accessory protein CooC1